MEQRSLILLGLLMSQSQHGYQINEFIERNLSNVTDMKKSTAYATLDRLNQNGYIDISFEQEGNRPIRKVYTVNEKGKQYFYELLLKNLSTAESVNYNGDIGLMFIDFLPLEKTIPSLKERLAGSKQFLQKIKETPSHGESSGVDLAIEHKITMLKAEIAFLEKTIKKLSLEQKKEANQ